MIELRQGDRQMERNSKIRATIKQMFENGEMGLTKLMRRRGALLTKTQAAKKARGQMRRQQAEEQGGGVQRDQEEQAFRQVFRSVTDDVDPDAPEARQGRAWQEGRGGGRARPARGRGAGRGRGGRVQGSLRSTCDRCGEEYARTYLRYHQRRCVGVMDCAWGEGRGGAGARIAAIREEAREGVRRGGRRQLPPSSAHQLPPTPHHHSEPEVVQEAGTEQGTSSLVRSKQVGVQEAGDEEDGRAGARSTDDGVELSDLEEINDLEDDDDEDILAEVDELERTVFAENPDARTRGQKRTAMSVASEDETRSPLIQRPRRNLRRRSYWLGDHLLETPPTPQQPQVPQPSQASTSSLVRSKQGYAHHPPTIPLRRPEDPAGSQARDLFSTETSQAAGPSRPTSPFAAPPSHVNRFDSEDNLVDQWGNIIDMNAVEFEVCHEDQQEGHDLVFNMSTPTRGLVRDIQQQQRRGENELDLCLNICYMYLSFSVRIRSEDTPRGAHILDLGEDRLHGIVTRLRGRGLTPVESSTPGDEQGPPPPPPDVSAVLEPSQLQFRFLILSVLSA